MPRTALVAGERVLGVTPGMLLAAGPDGRLAGMSPAQASGADLSFTYNQVVPASIWTILHGLGKFPAVSVVDSAGDLVEGDVSYPNVNTVRITFTGAFAGTAYLN